MEFQASEQDGGIGASLPEELRGREGGFRGLQISRYPEDVGGMGCRVTLKTVLPCGISGQRRRTNLCPTSGRAGRLPELPGGGRPDDSLPDKITPSQV